jgi:hypothetical protein
MPLYTLNLRIGVSAPNGVKEDLFGENATSALGHEEQQVILQGGQLDLFASGIDSALSAVDDQLPISEAKNL